MADWTWVAASRRGTSHERTGDPRQDAYRCVRVGRLKPIVIAVVCDGAGSARFGGQGAMLASRALSQRAKAYCRASHQLPSDALLIEWIDDARDQIAALANRRNHSMRDFATTVIFTASTSVQTVTLHIGDGAAVCRDSETGMWETLSWPEHGEYASTTFFLTDKGAPRARISRRSTAIECFSIFTDGIERLALNFAENRPHAPFFEMVSGPVVRSTAKNQDLALSKKLGEYLASDAINARTDDDKTLIVASVR